MQTGATNEDACGDAIVGSISEGGLCRFGFAFGRFVQRQSKFMMEFGASKLGQDLNGQLRQNAIPTAVSNYPPTGATPPSAQQRKLDHHQIVVLNDRQKLNTA